MKKTPYGISDFNFLKTEDYFFIDKTDYIPKIEKYIMTSISKMNLKQWIIVDKLRT